MLIIGLMSGTSVDGIDAALVDIRESESGLNAELLCFHHSPFTSEMREAILRLSDPTQSNLAELTALNFVVGELFGEAAIEVCRQHGTRIENIDAIASHGQTIWHQPNAISVGGRLVSGTMQIGAPAVISAITGCTVVSDFRSADMAVGGQGAPLVPYADWILFGDKTEHRLLLNIGGIANLTWLPAGCTKEQIIAFDTGPGNMLIDLLVTKLTNGEKSFDENGAMAKRGRADERMLTELALHPYFQKLVPKSTGREDFGTAFLNNVIIPVAESHSVAGNDLIASVTGFTVQSIIQAIQTFLPQNAQRCTLICAGGGVNNRAILEGLQENLPNATVCTTDEYDIPSDSREAIAFAILGYKTILGEPSNVIGATGAQRVVVLGSITNCTVQKKLNST